MFTSKKRTKYYHQGRNQNKISGGGTKKKQRSPFTFFNLPDFGKGILLFLLGYTLLPRLSQCYPFFSSDCPWAAGNIDLCRLAAFQIEHGSGRVAFANGDHPVHFHTWPSLWWRRSRTGSWWMGTVIAVLTMQQESAHQDQLLPLVPIPQTTNHRRRFYLFITIYGCSTSKMTKFPKFWLFQVVPEA